MKISKLFKTPGKVLVDNSPVVLTALGVTGTITTAWLTGKATFRASEVISKAQFKENLNHTAKVHKLTNREKFDLTWKLYLPAAGVGTMTCVSIICANRIGMRRAAALATAYGLSEKAFTEYREKVVEKMGEAKERGIRDEIAEDHMRRNPWSDDVVAVGSGKDLCYDKYLERYFYSDLESLKKSQNDINYQINNNFYASLTDFYNKLGVPAPSFGEEVGWRSDSLCELYFTTTVAPNNQAVHVVDFGVRPVRDYFLAH